MNHQSEQSVGTQQSMWSALVGWSDAANDDGELLTSDIVCDESSLRPSA